jgi:hypothetical protein
MRFRAGSINFEVSFPLVAVMTAVVVFDTTMSVLICFISAVMHEAGHLAAMRYFHSSPKTIKLTLFDIAITDTHKAVRNRKQDIIITLAGVTVNFISAAAGCIIYMLTGSQLCMFFCRITHNSRCIQSSARRFSRRRSGTPYIAVILLSAGQSTENNKRLIAHHTFSACTCRLLCTHIVRVQLHTPSDITVSYSNARCEEQTL